MPKRDPDTWMWERARELLEQADRLHRHFFQLGSPSSRAATWEPPIDVFETPTEVWVVLAVPGVDPARIEIVFDGATLFVTGERRLPEACCESDVHRLEIPQGRFARRVELPLPCVEIMRREAAHGCLLLGLKKRA